jgi:hypothetical protein
MPYPPSRRALCWKALLLSRSGKPAAARQVLIVLIRHILHGQPVSLV